jgi:hypothetical protein
VNHLPLPSLEINNPDRRLRGLEGLLSVTYEHLNLIGYKSHARLRPRGGLKFNDH